MKDFEIINGDSLIELEKIEKNSIDSIVTDPPYGLTTITKRFGKENSAENKYGKDGSFQRLTKGFMGKEWDGTGIEYNVDFWVKCYNVLKPGGYLLAFGGSRTYHRIACAIEDAGFEIRDCIMWIYGSGFPKSLNIGLAIDKKNGIESETIGNGKSGVSSRAYQSEETTTAGEYEIKKANNKWSGWGTALKPAYEPIIVARKPFKGSCVDNVIEYGVGGININECKIGNEVRKNNINDFSNQHGNKFGNREAISKLGESETIGRYPSNVILTYDETDFDEVCGGFPYTKDYGGETKATPKNNIRFNASKEVRVTRYKESGSASRYFYCAKASAKDRDEGLDLFSQEKVNDGRSTPIDNAFQRGETLRKNIHPTVKPIELMQYLVRLVTPKGGIVLDPFNGSGSTGKAVAFENRERNANYKYIGIELDKEYCEISLARIDYAINKYEYNFQNYLENKKEETGQINIFDLLD